ncbi:FK506-binding protein 4 [Kwoniella shandongensis]|uniref:FK506-binding protein n=1 Tax=Kwoniella shandongensis TaxID=1734106 RepID=A0A5M6BUZ4_9TREE|nr:FK506-binding protein 4 [Kwoniella shandongensis]KAA5526041.1 FK506-binding protein 4 [Kwoniella shandongensis]
MAVKMNLWSLTLLPGEKYPIYVRRDFQITNAALGEELRSADGRSVIKVTHNPIPAGALDSDSDDSDYDSEDDEELDSEEEAALRAEYGLDSDDEDEEADEEEKPKSKKAEKIEVDGEDEEDDDEEDSEDDDEDFEDELEETSVLASLTAGKIEQASLNLTFVEGEVVIFETTGENAVHLLGNYIDQFPDVDSESDSDSEFSGEDDYSDIYGSDDEDIELDTEEEEAVAKITEIPSEKPAKKALPASKKAAAEPEAKPAQKRKADAIESPAPKAAAAAESTEGLSKNQKKKLAKKAKTEETAAEKPAPVAAKKTENKAPQKRTLPSGLIIEDVKVGDGPVARTGKRLGMRYIGKLTNGKQFDANTAGKPFSFSLGKGEVIRGWDEGLAGMAVGGERRLTIPPQLAYGSQKIPGIPKNSTLKFDVKLVSIN